MGKTEIVAKPGSQTIEITREFNAQRDLVFRAYTDPTLLTQWLGGKDLSMEIVIFDVRDGGKWRYVHTSEDGTEFGFRGVFHGTPSVEGFTQTFEYEGWPGQVALERMTFEDLGNRTRLHIHSVYQSVKHRDAMIESGMESGMNAGFAKLDELLPALQADR